MSAYKFTVQRGKLNGMDVAVATGSAEAQGETLSVNIDVTNATSLARRDVLHMLDAVRDKVLTGPWPPLA
jgi:hypothetical protein